MRGHRLLKVQMPATAPGSFGSRIVSGELKITYQWRGSAVGTTTAASDDQTTDIVSEMVRKLVANPGDVSRFTVPLKDVPGPVDSAPGPPLGDRGNAVARFDIDSDGFVTFTGADLAATGVNLATTDASRISVWTNGEQQPVLSPQGGRAVEAGDQFTVYAHDNNSTYTTRQVYWIKTDAPALAPEMAPPTNAPPSDNGAFFIARKTIQQDTPPVLTKNDQFLTILGYRWVWWTVDRFW